METRSPRTRARRAPGPARLSVLVAALLAGVGACALLRSPPRPRDFPSERRRPTPEVVESRPLVERGGYLDWCAGSNRIAFERRRDRMRSEIHTVDPDGGNERCVTCGLDLAGDGPRRRHRADPRELRVGPVWHPGCELLVVQLGNLHARGRPFEKPPYGIHNDLWLVDVAAGSAQPLISTGELEGVRAPVFSGRGDRLVWSRRAPTGRLVPGGLLRLYPGSEDPWAGWRLMLAPFSRPPGGPAELGEPSELFPSERGMARVAALTGETVWYAHSRPGSRFVDELFRRDASGRRRQPLLRSPRTWEEQPQPSPWSTLVAYRSSRPYGWRMPPHRPNMVRIELWALTPAGEHVQLTRLNNADPDRRVKVEDFAWGPSGREIAIYTATFRKEKEPRHAIEILRLNGAF